MTPKNADKNGYKKIPEDLDDLDKKILTLLQDNATLSLRQLAAKTGSSTTAVRNRLEKLKKIGVIRRFSAVIDCCKIGYKEMVLLSIRINNSTPIDRIFEDLKKIRRINAIYQVSGMYPVFCMAKCISKEEEIELIEEVKAVKGVEEVITQIVLKCIKEDMRIIIE